jgi:hypothetical protein
MTLTADTHLGPYEIEDLPHSRLLPGHTGSPIYQIAFTPDSRWLVSCAFEDRVRAWSLRPAGGQGRAIGSGELPYGPFPGWKEAAASARLSCSRQSNRSFELGVHRVERNAINPGAPDALHSLDRPPVPQIDRRFPETTACSRPGRVRGAGGRS